MCDSINILNRELAAVPQQFQVFVRCPHGLAALSDNDKNSLIECLKTYDAMPDLCDLFM